MNEAMKDFSYNPVTIDIPRSKQTMKSSHSTTFDTGQLIPIYWREVLPGSTCKMDVAEVTRMQTPLFPVMGNAFIDVMFFFVPNRLLWKHWEEFMGENKSGYWEQPIDYEVPQIIFNSNNTMLTSDPPYWIKGNNYYPYAVQTGSLADYLGIPVVDANTTTPSWRGEFEVNALPFRAFYKIYNDWWRDENLMNPLEFDDGDSDITAYMGSSDPEAMWCLVPPPQVAKFHDYFTSALPQPQKGDDVLLPLGKTAPIIGGETGNPPDTTIYPTQTGSVGAKIAYQKTSAGAGSTRMMIYNDGTNGWQEPSAGYGFTLQADLANATGATISALRQAFSVQRYLEKLSRGGSRYIEQLKTMFGVTSPDARLQRSEYLGGCRHMVNIDQVVQTSSTDLVTPQGNVAAYSMSSMNEELFTKSFVEHGILMGLMVVRLEHSYQDGLDKMWLRKSKFSYYNPTFAHISEQAILNKELYLAGDVVGSKDEEAFGYQEAWAEYRYRNNHVSGEFRSKYFQTLDAWHFADNYGGLPTLSADWIKEYEMQLNRNLAVSSRLANQWMTDMFFEETWTQPMPLYSIPGLIDHY